MPRAVQVAEAQVMWADLLKVNVLGCPEDIAYLEDRPFSVVT